MDQKIDTHRADIDGLRGIAILSVIGFHVGIRWMSGGFVGVDVFFVISGFLISTIILKDLESRSFTFTEFYARRIRRIFPALIVVLLAVWGFGWFALLPDEYIQLAHHIEAGAGFLSNILLLRESGYFDAPAALKPLLHLWSLGIEEQYYLVWPLALFLIWKSRVRFLSILLLLVISFALNVERILTVTGDSFYLPHTRFWELLIGSALGYALLHTSDLVQVAFARLSEGVSARHFWSEYSVALQNTAACLGLFLVMFAIVRLDSAVAFPGYAALLPTLGTALIIAGGPVAWINRRLLGNRVLTFIGLISYPLYLWHWPVLWGLRILTMFGEPSFRSQLIAVACAFFLAWLTYRFVERPIRQRQGLFRSDNRAIPLLVSGLLTVCILGAFIVKLRGVPARFSEECRQFMTYKEEEHTSGWRSGTCFLNPTQDWHSFRPECVDEQPRGAPLVFLWGDSHAADLYPGIRELQRSHGFRLAQFNASACPPILNFDQPVRKHCRDINGHVFKTIVKLRPETVLLVAQVWFFPPADNHEKIAETIADLKQAGVRRVVIIGPNPDWKMPLPRLCLGRCKIGLHHTIPVRMSNLSEHVIENDHAFDSWVTSLGATYVSPANILCNQSGCLTRVQVRDRADLVSFDQHHLTTVGSEYLAPRIVAVFAENLSPNYSTQSAAPVSIGGRMNTAEAVAHFP